MRRSLRAIQWPFPLGVLVLTTALALACAPAAPPTPTPAPPKPAAPAPAPTLAPKPAAPAPAPTPVPPTVAPKPAPTTAPAATAAAKPVARERFAFPLTWRAGGSFAAYYLARDRGYFAEQGLDIEIVEGTGGADTAKIVAAGSSPIGMSDGGIAVKSVSEGMPIKVIATTMQTSPMSIIVPKKSGITTPKQLEGKKLGGSPGSAGEVLLPAWLKLNGADPNKVQLVTVTPATRLTTLLQGQVDGVVAFYYDNVPILKDKGLDVVPIRYADFGFNVPGANIIANNNFIKEKPDVARRFLAGALKGYAEAKKNPKAAIDSVTKQVSTLDAKLEMEALVGMLEMTHSKRSQGKPLGWMAREDWEDAINLLNQHADLKVKPKVDDVFTNDFVPAP